MLTINENVPFETSLATLKEKFVKSWAPSLQEEWRETLQLESEPVTKLLEVYAYLETLIRARINYVGSQQYLAFAEGKNLDKLAEFYDLQRLAGESDEHFRTRLIERIRGSSVAGTAAHYRWQALSVDAKIREVFVTSPRAGYVEIYIAADDADLVAKVQQHIQRGDVKVLTDTVAVKAAIRKEINVIARLQFAPTANRALLNSIRAELQQLHFPLGTIISRSALFAHLHRENVLNVELIAPTENIHLAAHEYAVINNVELHA